MADETPPAGGRGRKIPVPAPVLIGLGVAIVAGIYLMRRNKTAAAAQPAAPAPAPVVMAGQNGGGIPSGLLYALLQNLQSSPAPVGPSAPRFPATTINLAAWQPGLPENQQAWNADFNNIAAHYGISVAQLEQANPQLKGSANWNSIPPGSVVNIPAH